MQKPFIKLLQQRLMLALAKQFRTSVTKTVYLMTQYGHVSNGSAPAMEAAGAEMIWSHSLQKYNCRYTKLLGDGDSKTHERLVSTKPYGDDCTIEKLECVGHVLKCLGKQLLNLKTSVKGKKLQDHKTLSGKGRLTKTRLD